MNYGIGNVKGKSSGGGGGIPVITLQASQMVDSTHIQFTEEQYNTIVANGCFYLDILGSQQLLMTCVNASNLADIQCYNISQTGSGLQLATIDLNKSTYIGVLGISPYPQAKQLYQHNIKITKYEKFTIMLSIINDSNTAFTINTLIDYLYNNSFTTSTSVKESNGVAWYGNTLYNVLGLFAPSNSTTTIKHIIAKADVNFLDYTENIDLSSTSIYDTIIAL